MLRILCVVLCVACGETSERDPVPPPSVEIPGIELVDLPDGAASKVPLTDPPVVISPAAITIAGRPVVTLHAGAVDAADRDGGGMRIPKVTLATSALPGGRAQPLAIALDRHVTYHLLVDVLFSAKHVDAGWKDFQLVARSGTSRVAIPISLPDRKAVSSDDHVANALMIPASPTDAVSAKIRSAYITGIQRCYKELLEARPAAKGKLKLTLTVAATGKPSAHHVDGFDAKLDACVDAQMASWQFPAPPAETTVQLTIQLTPGGDQAPPAGVESIASSSPGVVTKLAAPAPVPPEHPLQLIVSVSKKAIQLWSISGEEGTISDPKLRVARTDPTAVKQLGEALAEIIKRRWAAKRPEDSRTIIFMADGDTTMDTVLKLIAAMRTSPQGGPLFPDVVLSSGFE